MKNIAQGNEISDSGSGIHVSDQETDFESESVVSDSSNDADEQAPEREGEWSKNLDNTRVIPAVAGCSSYSGIRLPSPVSSTSFHYFTRPSRLSFYQQLATKTHRVLKCNVLWHYYPVSAVGLPVYPKHSV